MKSKRLLLFAIFLIVVNQAKSQGADWEKDMPGRLIKAPSCKIPGFKIDALFGIINRIPVITQPKGYDVQQLFYASTKGKVYNAHLVIRFPLYYSFGKGPVKIETAHPPIVGLYINDPKQLMNEQSILFPQEAMNLNLPVMFTDTFSITYKNINGENVGSGTNTQFDSRLRFYVLNPRHTRFFKSITQEQYIRFWIGKLSLDIDKDTKQVEEGKSNLAEISGNPTLRTSIPEIQKNLNAFIKWVDFLKGKKKYYEKKLANLSPEEKKLPAYYAMQADGAAMMDKNGNYKENISGHIPYEPAEGTDALFRTPIYTFINEPFDSKLPKAAFQLIVIVDPYREGEKDEIKEVLDKQFYPLLSFKEIAELMYK